MHPTNKKYLSVIGLTFIISGMTSFSNIPQLGALVAIVGGLMILITKWNEIRRPFS